MRLNAGIITPHLQETKEFYTSVLNFGIAYESDWFILFDTPGKKDQLAFLQPEHPSQQPIFKSKFDGRGIFLTIEVDDVLFEYVRVKSFQVPVEVELRKEEWGDHHFSIIDPNGIGIDIVQYSKPTDPL